MMTVSKPLTEVTQEAITVLLREIGVVNTVRFLNQYSAGYGNYVEERDQLFGHLTLDEIINEIKKDRKQANT
ncbi:MAG: hypothetical protein KJ063_05200 [Anaerolineae bacterium]|nr:hypothetical protein [Anaerolineae bacterium]